MIEQEKGIAAGEQLLVSVPEAMERLSLGRSAIYELIRSGRLRTVKVGRRRLVPVVALDEYVKELMGDDAA